MPQPQEMIVAPSPRISFGLPVFNGEETLKDCLDSLLGQHFADFEVVVCDNASTDGSLPILREYAARDPRIRLIANAENIGQIENVNRVFEESRGEYFRWIGVQDWLEPDYASHCIQRFDEDPETIVVTSDFRIHDEEGESSYQEYQGERLESHDPVQRLKRMLWFLHAGDGLYDPLYSLVRRSAMECTARIRMMAKADWMLAAELSLLGRFQHVPLCLAHRRKSYTALRNRAKQPALMQRYHPTRHRELPSSPWRLLGVLISIVWASPMTQTQRLRCTGLALKFFCRESHLRARKWLDVFRRERLGLTRANFASLISPKGREDR